MAWVDEVRAAIGALTPLALGRTAPALADRTGAVAYYPAVGLALGAVSATAAWSVAHLLGAPVPAVIAVAALELAGGFRGRAGVAAAAGLLQRGSTADRLAAVDGPIGAAGWTATVVALALKLGAAARMTTPAALVAA